MNHTPHDPSHPGAGQADVHPHAATVAGASMTEAAVAADTGGDHLAGAAPDPGSHPGPDQEPFPAFVPGSDPVPFPSGGGYAGQGAPPPPGVPARRGGRLIIAGIVAVVVIATVAVGLRSGGDDGAGGGTDAAGEPTGEPSSGVDDLPSNAGPAQTAEDSDPFFESGTPELEVVDQGFSSFDGGQGGIEGSWAVVVANSGDASTSLLRVDVVFKDAAGALIASDSQVLKHVPAGEEMGVAREFLPGDLPAQIDSMDVTLGEVQPAFAGGAEGAFTISGVTLSLVDEAVISGWRAVFTIDSSYETTVRNPDIYAVFRDADGEIVGGAFTVHGTVPPGTSAGEITSYGSTPGVVSADIYLIATGG